MPPAGLAGRQRVRTGCLICRRRRRKCDEHKPSCENCVAKGLTCEYRLDVTFVQPPDRLQGANSSAFRKSGQPYTTVKFVIDNVANAAVSSSVASNDLDAERCSLAQSSHSFSLQLEQEISNSSSCLASTEHEYSIEIERDVLKPAIPLGPRDSFGKRQKTAHGVDADRSPRLSVVNQEVPNSVQRTDLSYESASYTDSSRERSLASLRLSTADITEVHPNNLSVNVSASNYLIDRPEKLRIRLETDLLCHYRYNIAPLIDIGDPESFFGIKTVLMVNKNPTILAALLALAARHRTLVAVQANPQDVSSAMAYSQEADRGLTTVIDKADLQTLRSLLMLRDFFSLNPRQWRDLLFMRMTTGVKLTYFDALGKDMNEPIFWLYLKIDLASAVIQSQLPIFDLSLVAHDSDIGLNLSLTGPQSPTQVFRQIAFILARSLSLIFGLADLTATTPFSPRWMTLWTDCQTWFRDRPLEVQPVVEVRAAEVEASELNSPAFPVLIYATPLSLVANTAYHIACFLLLVHKPRLLKPLTGPRRLMSHIWHAQSIAGITTSNDSHVQWDPLVVAGVLLVAVDMTHRSQQLSLLEKLREIAATTGMNLYGEIESLQKRWSNVCQ